VAAHLPGRVDGPLIGGLVDVLRWLEDMNRILAPEIGDRFAAAVAIRLHPDRRIALGELVRIIDIHSNNDPGGKATRPLPLV
jgi:hypothetical protein